MMRWTCAVVVALLTMSAASAQLASSAPRIDRAIEQSTSALTTDQIRQLDEYVRYWIGSMSGGDAAKAVAARDQLIQPLDRGGTGIFLSAYSGSLSRQLVPLAGTSDPVAGLNGMIVASRLMDPGAIDVIKAGLKNSGNVPVRYWAAKSVEMLPANLARRDPNLTLTSAEQRALLEALVAAADAETSEHVMRQILPSIVSLTIPEAGRALLNVLDARAAAHAKDPNLSVGAEFAAMRRMYPVVVRERLEGKLKDDKRLAEIARVSYLYLSISTRALQKGDLSRGAESDHAAMVPLADQFLRFCVEQVKPDAKSTLPARADQFLGNWDRLAAEIAAWPVILTSPPFSFDPKALTPG